MFIVLRTGRKTALACLLALGFSGAAWSTPILGAAQSFAVLGGTTVTNTGPSTVNGNVGSAPGTALTGFGAATLLGTVNPGDAAADATRAHGDAIAAGRYLSSLAFTRDLSGLDLGGMTLGAGVYRIASSAQLTGTLVLDAQNMADALFVFQIGTSLTSAAASSVRVVNASADTGVFFGVGTSAVLGAGSVFAGNIIASDSITLGSAAAVLCGRALALNGAVTLDTNQVSNDCRAGGALGSTRTDYASEGFAGIPAAANDVPEPASALLLALGLAALAYARRSTPA